VLIHCSPQDSQGVSEEEVDKMSLDIKASEEETSIEGSPKATENGSENSERRDLEVSDVEGTLHFGPFKTQLVVQISIARLT